MTQKYAQLGIDSAWRRFELSRGSHSDRFERAMRLFEANAGDLNLEASTVHVAAEIAALSPALNDEDRLAIIALILISIAACEQGSTRFPVGDDEDTQIRAMLNTLAGSDECAEYLAAIKALVAGESAAEIIGHAT